MNFDSYLLVKSQLAAQNRALVQLQGFDIQIEISAHNKVCLSTKIFNCLEGLSKEGIFSSLGLMGWSSREAFLYFEPASQSIYLVEESEALSQYIPFKDKIHGFLQVASEWREVLESLSLKTRAFA
jgi:hypothetical protein